METPNGTPNRERSRSPRERPARRERRRSGSQDRGRERPVRRGGIAERRVQISNIPYEFRWQELKDLFRDEVGEVAFVEIFESPKGTGIIEFNTPDLASKAIEKMHRFEVRGRKLVVKEDSGDKETRRNRTSPRRNNNNNNNNNNEERSRWSNNNDRSGSPAEGWGFTYGLSPAFLESLDVKGPLVNRVFIANLDYKVDDKKLEEVFSMAGKIIRAEINKDRDGKSRGHGVVVFDHPVESVQAISMFHQQALYERSLIVRMDRVNDKPEHNMPRLPEGLKGIGMGLGENGRPLTDVSRSIPMNVQNAQIQNMNMNNQMNPMGGNGGPGIGPGPNMGMNALANMANLAGMNFQSPNPNMNNMLPNNLLASLNSGNLTTLLSALGQAGAGTDLSSMGGLGGMGSSMGPNGGMGSSGGMGPTSGMGPTGGMGAFGGMGASGVMGQTGGMGPNGGGMGSIGGMGSVGGMGPSGPMGGAGLAGASPASNMGNMSAAGYNTGNSGPYSSGSTGGAPGMGSSGAALGFGGSNIGAGSYGSGNSGNGGFGNTGPTAPTGAGGYNSNTGNVTPSYGNRNSYEVGTSPYQVKEENQFRPQNYNTSPMDPANAPIKQESDTIAIRNLPPSVTWQALRDKFREFGDVKFAEIRKDVGYVRFNNQREALRAASAMNRTRVEGRNIEVTLL